jgi:hypothetical protein
VKPFERRYRKIVQASAVYDWIMTVPFAFPVLVSWHLSLLTRLHNLLGLEGKIPSSFEPLHLFFINLLGSIVIVWSTLRLVKPDPHLGLFDGFARILFSAWMFYYLIVWNVTGLLWFLVVPESLWGIIQLYGYWLYRKEQNAQFVNCRFARKLLSADQSSSRLSSYYRL